MKESFKRLKEWEGKGIHIQQMSINISMRQLFHHAFITDVQKLCETYLNKALCSKLVFEITETSLADDVDQLIEKMKILKRLGIRFSMDDFGTGYSSLSYLRRIPIDEVKIDKSFIFELGKGEQDGSIVKTILDIAKNLHLSITAEGVENEVQKDFLIKNECDLLQGYYFAKPMHKSEFETFTLNRMMGIFEEGIESGRGTNSLNYSLL